LVLSLGGSAEDIIFANPCKSPEHVIFARNAGVKLLVVDSSEEAEAVQELYPEAELILRIAVTDTDAPNPMGKKFGAPKQLWEGILESC
jgi:ornithine decarboxylase